MIAFNRICFLSKREAQALLTYASEEATRPISGIHFDGERNQVAATNGHQLAVCRLVQGQLGFSVTVSRESLNAALKACAKGLLIAVWADGVGTCPEASVTDLVTLEAVTDLKCMAKVDGFPRYDAVLTLGSSVHHTDTQAFSPAYLANLSAISLACQHKREEIIRGRKVMTTVTPAVELSLGADALSPATWSCKSVVGDWRGMLMPVRM